VDTKQKLESEQKKLADQQVYVQSPYYLEKVARDELHLSKPGETVVIVPDSQQLGNSANQQSQEVKEKTNWQKWWGVVSGSD
jgi:hypothetical protein